MTTDFILFSRSIIWILVDFGSFDVFVVADWYLICLFSWIAQNFVKSRRSLRFENRLNKRYFLILPQWLMRTTIYSLFPLFSILFKLYSMVIHYLFIFILLLLFLLPNYIYLSQLFLIFQWTITNLLFLIVHVVL